MLEIFEKLEDTETTAQQTPVEYGFDFERGVMTGEKVTGLEAIKVWAHFALRIQRYRFRQFTWAYGSQAEELIGKNYGVDYEISELKRYITDCLRVNPYITDVTDFTTSFEDSILTATFSIVTDYGTARQTIKEDIG